MPTMQYGRVARDGVVSVSYIHAAVVLRLWEVSGRSKSESAVYPYGLSRQTPRSSVGMGPSIDSMHPNWIDKHGR